MRKFLYPILAALTAGSLAVLLVPTNAYSAPNPASKPFGVKASCKTNTAGYCTISHGLGVVPDVIQAQAINYNALTTTRNWTSTSVEVRLGKRINTNNVVDPWSNVTVQVSLLGMYTPAVHSTPTTTPTTAPTTTPPTTSVPTTQPTITPPTTAPTTTPPIIIGAYPTAASTGVPAGTELTTHTGDLVITEENTSVVGKKVTGDVLIKAAGAVIRNSEISGRVINDSIATHHAFTIEDSTVGPATGCAATGEGAIGTENYVALRVEIRGFSDAFRIAGGNVTIQDSFVKLCSTDPNAHSDGIQAYGAADGKNIVIKHNVIDQRSVLDGTATAPIFIPNDGAQQGNQNISVAIDDNVLAGGGFSLRVFGDLPFTATSVTGNKIVDGSWTYGPLDVNCAKILDWSGNAVVEYDWNTGEVTRQVRSLDSACE